MRPDPGQLTPDLFMEPGNEVRARTRGFAGATNHGCPATSDGRNCLLFERRRSATDSALSLRELNVVFIERGRVFDQLNVLRTYVIRWFSIGDHPNRSGDAHSNSCRNHDACPRWWLSADGSLNAASGYSVARTSPTESIH